MYTFFLDGLQDLYQQTTLVFKMYTDLLQSKTQRDTNEILSGDTSEKSKDLIQPFPKRSSPAYYSNHQILYYDFSQHHSISPLDWEKKMKREFQNQMQHISEKITGISQEVGESMMKNTQEFFRYNFLYTSHLLNPLFIEEHYEQFKRKHIGIQGKEGNVVFAFAFPPEEMNLYKGFNSLNLSWKKIQESILVGLSQVISKIEALQGDYEKIRLFGPDEAVETNNQDRGNKTTISEIRNFMIMIESFDPESYLLFDRELLIKSHQEMKRSVQKRS